MANYTSTHTGATIDASVTIISGSGVTQSDLTKLNAVTSSAVELNLLDGVTASTVEINILDGVTASTTELNYLDGADSSITTLSLPDNTTITTFGASLIDDADAAAARTTLGVDAAGTDNSTDVTLVTTSYDYLSISGQAITLGQIDISDDTNLVGGTGITLTGDTLSTTDSEIVHDNLSGFVSNEHIDHSTVSISAGTGLSGGGDLTSTRTLSTNDSEIVHDNLSGFVANEHIDHSSVSITAGTGLSGGGDITTTRTLTTDDSAIVHDNLSGFVANEHIDHSGVSITAGAGLTGGGDITATRDIAVGAGTGVTVNADDIAIGQDVATTADVTFNSVTSDDFIGSLNGAVQFQAKATVALNKGDAVYVVGISGNTPTIALADANDATKMPSFGLAASSASIDDVIEVVTFGTLTNINTSAFSQGDVLFISSNGTSGNTLTATKEAGESVLCQNIGKVIRSHATVGSIKVGGAGRANATPNLNNGNIFIGNASNQSSTASLNTKIQDYLNTGVNLPSPTFTGDINFTDASTPQLTVTDTTNSVSVTLDADNNTGRLGTSSDHNLLIRRNGANHIQLYSAYTMHNQGGADIDFRAKDSSGNVVFKVDAGTSTTEIGTLSVTGNSVLAGDLQVNGTTTTVNQTNLDVSDNIIGLNRGAASNANDSGLIIERGSTGDNVFIGWDESLDRIRFATTAADASSTGDLSLTNANIHAGRLYADVTGDVTGNADTATTLATARNFSLTGDVTAGAVSFDGSGNVALSTTIAANSVALGTDTTGNYMSDLTEGTGIDITHTPAEGSNATIALDLTEVGFGGGANRLITDDGDGTVTAEANLTYSSLTLQIPSADGKVSVDKIEGYSNNTNSLFLNDDQTAANNMVSLQSINHINIMTDGNNNGVGDFRVYNGSYDIDTADLVFKVDSSGVLTSTDSSESMEYTPSNNYLTIHETGATKGSHLRLATDNSDFILSAGGSANQLSLYDVNGTANRLVVNSSGLFQFLNGISVSGDATFDTDTLKVDSTNNRVGIGTTSPDYELDVAGDIGVNHLINHNGDTNTYVQFTTDRLRFAAGGEVLLDLYEDGTQDYVKLGDGGDVDINLNDDMFVEGSSGNVGIGETSPEAKLHIKNASAGTFTASNSQLLIENNTTVRLSMVTPTNNASKIEFGDVDDQDAGILEYNNSDNSMRFTTNTSEAMRIDSSGNALIGRTSAFSSASVEIQNDATEQLTLNNVSTDGKMLSLYNSGSIVGGLGNDVNELVIYQGTTEAMRIDSSQNVGIGTNSPSAKLHVDGSAIFDTDTGNQPFSITRSGNTNESLQIYVDDSSVIFQTFQDETSGDRGNFEFRMDSDSTSYTDFKHGTATKMRITSAGNVGIGGNTPQSRLMVATSAESSIPAAGADSSFFNVGNLASETTNYGTMIGTLNTGNGYIQQQRFDGTATTYNLLLQPNGGNVGIGVTSPDTYNVQLASGYKIGVDTSSGGTTRIAEIEFYNTGDGSLRLKTDNSSSGGIEFHTEGSKILEVTRGGDVSITASSRLYFDSGVHTYIEEDSGDRLRFFCGGAEFMRFTEDTSDTLGLYTNNTLRVSVNNDGDVLPAGDGTQDLGASTKRWAIVYSADLDLSNEGSQNDVDGTWGSYVIQEGEEDLFLINRRNGKKYKFMLQEVQD